jgi:hypothetical protein
MHRRSPQAGNWRLIALLKANTCSEFVCEGHQSE